MTRRCDCGRVYDRCSRCDYDRSDEPHERRESTATMLFAAGIIILITFVIPVILMRLG